MTTNEYKFGLYDVKIAVWNAAESYGTAVDVESVQMLGISFQNESGQLDGDDIITDVHSRTQSVEVRLRFGFKNLDVYEVLTGATNTESTTVMDSMIIARQSMPYFAICGRVEGTEGDGDTQVFIPKCKIMDGFSVTMEKGAYITPEVTAMAVYEGATYGMGLIINHATGQAVTLPPT